MSVRLSAAARRVAFAVTSRLLLYPEEELLGELPLLRDAVGGLPAPISEPLRPLLAHLATTPLLALQADYVATFDLRRRNCLYLTYFLNGDTRRRGQALWRFQDLYRRRGRTVADGELADFLPALLELVAEAATDDAEPLDLLLEHLAGIVVVRRSLEDERSPWAGAVLALERSLPGPTPRAAAAADRILAEGPPAELVGLEATRLDASGLEAFAPPGPGGGRP